MARGGGIINLKIELIIGWRNDFRLIWDISSIYSSFDVLNTISWEAYKFHFS